MGELKKATCCSQANVKIFIELIRMRDKSIIKCRAKLLFNNQMIKVILMANFLFNHETFRILSSSHT